MSKIMYSQKWVQLNNYPLDYFELLFQYYAAAGNRLPVTYYNLDMVNSVFDQDLLHGGSYELTGDLSGMLWKKILMLQVYNVEPVDLSLTADERGIGFHEKRTSLYLPTCYEFQPTFNDFIVYDQIQWRQDPFESDLPLYRVVNMNKASSTNITFWKLFLEGSPKRKSDLDDQLSGNYTFLDYEKKIYKTDDAINLTKQRTTNSNLNVNNFYEEQMGLYVSSE